MTTRLRRTLLTAAAATVVLAACADTRSESDGAAPVATSTDESSAVLSGRTDSTKVARTDVGVDITRADPDDNSSPQIDQLDPETSSILSAFLPGSYSGIDDAHGRLVAACMQNLGFEYDANHDHQASDLAPEQFLAADIGLRTIEQAEQVGYGPLGTAVPIDEPDPASLTPEYLDALLGPDHENPTYVEVIVPLDSTPSFQTQRTGGCVRDATEELYGSVETSDQLSALQVALVNLGRRSIDAAVASPTFQSALSAWSSCMAGRGYPGLATPTDPIRRDWPDPRPGQDESAMAIADAQCQHEAELRSVAFQELTTEFDRSEQQYATLVTERNELYDNMLSRASQVP